MPHCTRATTLVVLLAVAAGGSLVGAENDGQADLDKATEAKWDAKTLNDLDEVIRLCESAVEKGLDEGNTRFAKTLLASTLLQRASSRAQQIFTTSPTGPKASELRKAALEDLEKAVQIDRKLPRALFLIAQLNRLPGGDTQRGRAALDQLIEMDTEATDLRSRALILRSTIQVDPQKKLADLDEAVRLAPSQAAAFRARAAIHVGLGKLDEATADCDKAIELDPKHAGTYKLKAEVLGLLKKYDEALVSLDKARELEPRSVDPLIRKARIHAAQKNLDAALVDLDLAASIDPDNLQVLLLRAGVYQELKQGEQALADIDQVLKLRPDFALAWQRRALFLAAAEKYDEALVSLDKARELNPRSVDPLMDKARVHAAQKNLDAALVDLDLAASIDPDNLQVLLLRAGVHQELDQAEQAMADIDQVLKLRPDFPPALQLRALLLTAAEKFDEAIAEWKRLRELQPDDVQTSLQLGMCYNAAKKIDKAVEIYSAILAKHPDQWRALRGRGDALLNSGKQAEAIADYEKARELQPDDSGILNNLAWVLATSPDEKLRDQKRAVELATKACEVTKYEAAHILSTLAAAYAEGGDFETAIKWVEKGLEIAKEDQKEPLGKELDSYKAGKPWRELLRDGEPVKPE